jgi:hypothetical protein
MPADYKALLGKIADAWVNYPGYLMEKSITTGNNSYLLLNNFLPLVEGVAVGGIAYYFSRDKEAFFFFPFAAVVVRHFQTRSYVFKNYERLRRLRKNK